MEARGAVIYCVKNDTVSTMSASTWPALSQKIVNLRKLRLNPTTAWKKIRTCPFRPPPELGDWLTGQMVGSLNS